MSSVKARAARSARPSTVQGAGVLYRFDQASDSAGFWGYDASGKSRYSSINVRLDIIPVDLAVKVPATAQ